MRRRGFTLVELLVVVGIISVLVAILLPVLSRARDQALTVQCANNLRQVVAAMVTYESEFRCFPILRDPGYGLERRRNPDLGFAPPTSWAGMLVEWRYLGGADLRAGELGPLSCPAVDDYNRNPSWLDYQPHYGYNDLVYPLLVDIASYPAYYDAHAFFGRRGRMAKGDSSRKILLVETWGTEGYRAYNEAGEMVEENVTRADSGRDNVSHTAVGYSIGVAIDYRHRSCGAVNVAYMAGNVETVTRPDRLPRPNDFTDDHPFGAQNFAYTP